MTTINKQPILKYSNHFTITFLPNNWNNKATNLEIAVPLVLYVFQESVFNSLDQ